MQKADKIVLKYLGIYMFLTIKEKGSHTFEGEQGRGIHKKDWREGREREE